MASSWSWWFPGLALCEDCSFLVGRNGLLGSWCKTPGEHRSSADLLVGELGSKVGGCRAMVSRFIVSLLVDGAGSVHHCYGFQCVQMLLLTLCWVELDLRVTDWEVQCILVLLLSFWWEKLWPRMPSGCCLPVGRCSECCMVACRVVVVLWLVSAPSWMELWPGTSRAGTFQPVCNSGPKARVTSLTWLGLGLGHPRAFFTDACSLVYVARSWALYWPELYPWMAVGFLLLKVACPPVGGALSLPSYFLGLRPLSIGTDRLVSSGRAGSQDEKAREGIPDWFLPAPMSMW